MFLCIYVELQCIRRVTGTFVGMRYSLSFVAVSTTDYKLKSPKHQLDTQMTIPEIRNGEIINYFLHNTKSYKRIITLHNF